MVQGVFFRALILPVCLAAIAISMTEPGFASYHKSHSIQPPFINRFGIFGDDTLNPVPQKYDFVKRSIGRLWSKKNGQRISCTAFCVAPDVVATASHCLFSVSPSGQRPPLTSFEVDFEEDQRIVRTKIAGNDESSVRWNVLAGATRFPSHTPLLNTHDWALLKLATNGCDKRTLKISKKKRKLELLAAIATKKIFTIGYMRRGDDLKLTFSGNCQSTTNLTQLKKTWATIDNMFVDAGDLVAHRCNFTSGASGSPLFLRTKKGPVIIGLNNGTIPVPARFLIGKSYEERRKILSAIPTATNIAVNANAFVKQIDIVRLSTPRLESAEIKRLQIFLRSSGHYPGMLDGIYDVPLRQAILDFERERKLLVTGRPTLSLMRASKK